MFHIKVWLTVILSGIITLQLWWMQPALKRKVDEERDRLRPLLYGQRFEYGLRHYYNRLKSNVLKLASDRTLRKIVSQLNYDVEEELGMAMNYSDVHDKLRDKWAIHKKIKDSAELYMIVSKDGYVIYRSDSPKLYNHEKDKLKYGIPHVTDALHGRTRTGLWILNGKTSLVAAAPIYHIKKKKKVMASILYARRFDSSVFKPISKFVPKGTKVILFKATETSGKDEEPTLAPFAYNLSDPKMIGLFRGWFKKIAYDEILDKFIEGMDRDRLTATVNEVEYNFMVGLFPADLGPPNIGYVLLVPRPKDFFKIDRKNYYQSGGPLIFSLICFIFIFLLGTWLSGAEIYYFRRVLPPLQTAPQDGFPNIPDHGLSRPWKKLVHSINRIFTMIRERGLGNQDMKPKNSLIEESNIDAVGLLAEESSETSPPQIDLSPSSNAPFFQSNNSANQYQQQPPAADTSQPPAGNYPGQYTPHNPALHEQDPGRTIQDFSLYPPDKKK